MPEVRRQEITTTDLELHDENLEKGLAGFCSSGEAGEGASASLCSFSTSIPRYTNVLRIGQIQRRSSSPGEKSSKGPFENRSVTLQKVLKTLSQINL